MIRLETTVQGLRIHYIDQGQGTPVLFLQGWGTTASLYTPILDHISKKFRVLAPDLPGFGDSEEPSVPWGSGDYVEFAWQFLADLGITSCILIGHSHGGRMILNWLSRPEQPVTVKKCVLCGAAGLIPPRSFSYYCKVYTYKAGKLLLKPFPKLAERFRNKAGSADYQAASPIMRSTLTRVVNENYLDRLKDIKASTLLVWGDGDTATPLVHGQTMEQHIPDAGLVVLKGTTHYAILEQCGQFCRVLDAFL